MLEEQLEKFGLSEKEAKTYLTLLISGETNATAISKESGINRSSVYVLLEALGKKGLVYTTQDDGVQTFKAAPPEKLHEIAEERLKEHQSIKETIEKLLPDLKGVHKDQKYRPKVRVFEGKEGLIAAFEETLLCKEKEMRVVSSLTRLSSKLSTYLFKYVKQRIDAGIKMYGIHLHDKIGRMLLALGPNEFDEPILINKKDYKFPADLAIFDDKIAFMTAEGEGYAVSIESKEIAEVAKNIFDMAYQNAKKIGRDFN